MFHWHLTDSHSFPIELTKYPDTTGQMVNYGAYGDDKFYTIEQVKDIVDYANIRGKFNNVDLYFPNKVPLRTPRGSIIKLCYLDDVM